MLWYLIYALATSDDVGYTQFNLMVFKFSCRWWWRRRQRRWWCTCILLHSMHTAKLNTRSSIVFFFIVYFLFCSVVSSRSSLLFGRFLPAFRSNKSEIIASRLSIYFFFFFIISFSTICVINFDAFQHHKQDAFISLLLYIWVVNVHFSAHACFFSIKLTFKWIVECIIQVITFRSFELQHA